LNKVFLRGQQVCNEQGPIGTARIGQVLSCLQGSAAG